MDLDDYTLVAAVPAGDGAEGIALSPDGRQVWTGDRRRNSVTVIDTEGRQVIERLPAGEGQIRATVGLTGSEV